MSSIKEHVFCKSRDVFSFVHCCIPQNASPWEMQTHLWGTGQVWAFSTNLSMQCGHRHTHSRCWFMDACGYYHASCGSSQGLCSNQNTFSNIAVGLRRGLLCNKDEQGDEVGRQAMDHPRGTKGRRGLHITQQLGLYSTRNSLLIENVNFAYNIFWS